MKTGALPPENVSSFTIQPIQTPPRPFPLQNRDLLTEGENFAG